MMKAVRMSRHGGTEVLDYGDYPLPSVGPYDVLVRVEATSVSGWDVKYRLGSLPQLPGRKSYPLPMQPGRDAAGTVERVGEAVTRFASGDRVVGLVHPANPTSPLTIRGYSNLSTDIEYPGHSMFGGYAQYVARPESYWLPLPPHVPAAAAAAAMWSYATSHRVLRSRLEARLGDVVLVIGASGGMGSAALDLARAMGVRTIAVTRSAAKASFLLELGAAHVVVLGDDAAAEVRSHGGPLGLDGAVDFSDDPAMVRFAVSTLRPGGTIVITAGERASEPLPITALDCIRLELNVRGVRASTLDDQRSVVDALAHGLIHPAIHATMPMSQAREAQALLEAGAVSGRIVLDPWQ
jgi:putative oxidoreductase